MKRIAPIAALLVALLPVAVAVAQTPDEVAVELADSGVYVEPGLSRNVSELSADVARARNAGFGFSVALLDENPTGGATTFADALLSRVGGTVLVLSATGEGMASAEMTQADIEAALDRAFAVADDDESFVSAVVDSMIGVDAGSGDSPSSGGGSNSGLFIMLAIIVGLVLLVWFAIRRSKKSSERSRAGQIDEARGEIRTQLDSMANTLLEITDLVAASTSSQDDTYLRQASATFTEAEEAFGSATDLRALEDLSDRLDEARWQLDAAAAIADGKQPPPKPPKEQRYQCFFDPTHPNATETAEIETAAGKKTVRVCREDAEKLRRGSQPKPRMIDVGGSRVPAPMAPRSHGGGGLDWLETFSILAGGAGQAASYDWGGSRRRTAGRSTTEPEAKTAGKPVTPPGGRARAGRTRRRKR